MRKIRLGGSAPSSGPNPAAPAESAPPQRTAAPATRQGPARGFAAAFRDLVDRKLRELTGQRWAGLSEAQRRAEAARRGARDMARRIERETGRRPAESTIRRHAARGTAPKGVDQARADRQAAIDRAGGLKPFAARAGISQRAAGRWRDAGGTLAPPAGATVIVVEFTVIGDLFHAGKRGQITPDYDRQLTGQLHLSGEDAEVFVTAYAIEDTETQRDLLSDQITVQVLPDWGGRPGRTMTVKVIEDIRIHD
ncbi:hypothetical protein [Mycobacterium sp. shizuoka-1]|uniref:hypothetical protein n=1 Tax=Mycobacterium sp. shizuoka-1 TaxID=2039281 RepID=UPI000C06438F|nr:hypothetical protein [Mycobacterium sp. shizuoka-1]GAY19312.1 hypothetical protein MSZK_60380 [Mycobacterium sp. shizuoka-1]